jgi:hypothetical protein
MNRTPLQTLLALRDSDNVDDDVESVILPILRLGFPADHVARIEARALAQIARRLLQAGKEDRAWRIVRRALTLDPLNLDLVRMSRELGL